ncbi:MAG: type II secretion system F family protein [Patescibacteria group bacterium]
MPTYFYTAKSFNGKTETGSLNAKDHSQLAQSLKGKGLVLIEAVLHKEEKSRHSYNFSSFFSRVSETEKIMITKNLWVMFAAGLSMVKSFDILSAQASTKSLKKVLLSVKERINKGESMSKALSGYPNIFSELYCSMIKVGEESGTLEEVFQNLSLQLSKEHELKSKIQNAMIYPSLILLTMAAVGVLIITTVLPSLKTFFSSMNAPIPIYTKILLYSGDFLSKNWYLLIIVPLVLIFAFAIISKTKKGKWAIDTVLLKIPLISPLIKKTNSALLVRSLGSLVASGVPLVRALEISSGTLRNSYFKIAADEAVEKVKKGEKLSAALKYHRDIFPLGTVEMVEVGEETGKTTAILKKLADFYEQEAADATEKLSVAIEPILIIVLGVAVGFFAFSIIMPMYTTLGGIQ